MTDDVKPEVIKKTQDLLGKYFKKPPLTEKLLRKPPFRFLHDIISTVIKTTGFLEGLFTEEELNSENIKDKEAKLAYLTKLVDVVKLISGTNLSVRPSKIISGQEPTKTNELLQAIGKCLDKKVSSIEAIEHYKKNVDKKSKTSSKSKSSSKEESSKKTAGRQSSQSKKGSDKGSPSYEEKKRSSSTGKLSSKDGELHNTKEKTDSAMGDHIRVQEQENKKNETIDIPPAEPLQERRPSTSQKKRHSSSAKVKENTSSSMTASDVEQPSSGNLGKVKEEHSRRRESATRTKQPLIDSRIDENQLQNLSEPLTSDTRNINNVIAGNDNVELGTDVHTGKENISAVEPTQNELEKTESQAHESELPKSPQELVQSSVPPQRPRTSLRPPTARPISARPAAPRMRAKPELTVNEEIITPMGNINVIVESSDLKDDDDDADDMVVMESKGKIDSTDNSGNYKMDDQLTQEHGHLVAQILETQRELVSTDNVDVLPKKVDIAWETGSKRDREVMVKEIDRLRGTIQTLTRATNPLGKLLDYIQEDVEMMQKELLDWRNQYNQLSEQLEKEQLQTQELIEPMKETLTEIDRNMKDQLDKICQAKARIIKNDQKIKRLLSGNV